LLECLRDHVQATGRQVRFYQAGSSEMFGASAPPQDENTPFYPRSPYAVAKVAGFYYCKNYREAYNLFISNGILFNHESERRGETFVTRKITRAATRIKVGLQQKLFLGNMDAKRDWGHARDYVEAMWLMLQHDQPDDFVVSMNEAQSVQDFVEKTFGMLDLDWKKHVEIDPKYLRPTEVDYLLGDSSKARKALNWTPHTSFNELVRLMVASDLKIANQELLLKNAGMQK
jgi:GDPmannose 4,6-dehydratase